MARKQKPSKRKIAKALNADEVEINLTISRNIKRLRRENRMSMQDLADAVQCSKSQINSVEGNARNIGSVKFLRTAMALGVNNPYEMTLEPEK